LTGLIHPSAWKGYSAKFTYRILHKASASGARMPSKRLLGPGLREAGLALAERRESQRLAQSAQEVYGRAREDSERALEDLARAAQRADNALRLWEDAE
jgi:hypothetical protein